MTRRPCPSRSSTVSVIVDVNDSMPDFPVAAAPAMAAPATPAAPKPSARVLSMSDSTALVEALAVRSSSDCAPARMSAGDFGMARRRRRDRDLLVHLEVEAPIGCGHRARRDVDLRQVGRKGHRTGARSGRSSSGGHRGPLHRSAAFGEHRVVGIELAAQCHRLLPDIALSAGRPSTARSATVSNAEGLLCCAWISRSLR